MEVLCVVVFFSFVKGWWQMVVQSFSLDFGARYDNAGYYRENWVAGGNVGAGVISLADPSDEIVKSVSLISSCRRIRFGFVAK